MINTARKIKFSIKDFFNKCDQIYRVAQLKTYWLEWEEGRGSAVSVCTPYIFSQDRYKIEIK